MTGRRSSFAVILALGLFAVPLARVNVVLDPAAYRRGCQVSMAI